MLAIRLTLLLLGLSSAAFADRDIVYSARYYAPPGSHRTSHFHLYRINPDGTGKTQLTFGSADDDDPLWSPGGRWVSFTRRGGSGRTRVYLVGANGGVVRLLKVPGSSVSYDDDGCQWSPDARSFALAHFRDGKNGGSAVFLINPQTGQATRQYVGATDFTWSPDGKRGYVRFEKADKIVDLTTEQTTAVRAAIPQGASALISVVWSGSQTLVGLAGASDASEDGQVYLIRLGLNGEEIGRVPCLWGSAMQNPFLDSTDPWGISLLPVPRSSRMVTYVQDEGNSSSRPDNVYYLAETRTGRMRKFAGGQFLAWSPDASKFCTAEARHLLDYGKPVQGYQKSLYAASLQVGWTRGGTVKSVTPGLVWVTGADWRHEPKSTPLRTK